MYAIRSYYERRPESHHRGQRARRVAAEAGIEIVAMSTSPLRVSLFCEEARVDALVRALHGAFCERH